MARLLRGDIVWANLDPTQGHEQSGKRPVLIISHDVFNQKSGTAQPSWVKISQIRALSILRLSAPISHLSELEVDEIISGFNEIVS